MKKNRFSALVAIALAFAGTGAAHAEITEGSIYEFRPITALNDASTAMGSSQEIKFKMRLISSTPSALAAADRHQWEIYCKNPLWSESEQIIWWGVSPLRIGIEVSGQVRYCDMALPVPATSDSGADLNSQAKNCYQDIVCSYVTRAGDFAMPVRLAMPGGAYVFENGQLWGIRDATTGEEWNPTRFNNTAGVTYPSARPDDPRNSSTDLAWGFGADDASKAYFVKTIWFDRNEKHMMVDATGSLAAWRGVAQGDWRDTGVQYQRAEPEIAFETMPTNVVGMKLYVWSENDDIATVQFTNSENDQRLKTDESGPIFKTNMVDRTGKKRDFWVKTINVLNYNSDPNYYKFKIRGKQQSTTPAKFILSAKPGYTFHNEKDYEDLIVDFLEVEVLCTQPMPPTVTVEVDDEKVVAATNGYRVAATMLRVAFTEAFSEDVEVEIRPLFTNDRFPEGATKTNHWDFVRFAASASQNVSLQDEAVYMKYPKVTIPAGSLVPTKLNGGTTLYNGVLYVYAIYADAYSNSEKGQFKFWIGTDNAKAKKPSSEGGIDGWNCEPQKCDVNCFLVEDAVNPQLSTKVTSKKATAKLPLGFDIAVEDIWGNLHNETGYTLYVQSKEPGIDPEEDGWTALGAEGEWTYETKSGLLKSSVTGKSPTVTYNVPDQSYVTYFYVAGPNGYESPREADKALKVVVSVERANSVYVEVAAKDTETWVKSGKFNEGQEFSVRATLNKPVSSGEDVYAFLAPEGDAAAFVSGDAVTSSVFTSGMLIQGGDKETFQTSTFKLTDGTYAGKALKFDILLCRTQQWDPAQEVGGYSATKLVLTAQNVAPAVVQVTMDNSMTKVTGNDQTMHTGSGASEKTAFVAVGSAKTFFVKVNEPGEVDLSATGPAKSGDDKWATRDFTIEWTVLEHSGATASGTMTGNPSQTNFVYTFNSAGMADVLLKMHDKDMTDWTEDFVFHVDVSDLPTVEVEAPSPILENMVGSKNAPITVSLSDLGAHSIRAKVSVESNDKSTTDRLKLGYITIGGCDEGPYEGEDGNVYWYVNLVRGQANLFVDEADGTTSSSTKGLMVTVEIVDEGIDPASKKKWCDYYLAGNKVIFVDNVEPSLLDCDLGKTVYEGNTNAVEVGIGESVVVEYRVEDVLGDMTNATGISAQWWDTDTGKHPIVNIYDSTNTYSFVTKFKSAGEKQIKLTLTDKDGLPKFEGLWYFKVASTKPLITVANGPSSGVGNSTLSQRYAAFPGAGQGHTWSDATFSSAEDFTINWNCNPSLSSVRVYAWGYKVGAVDDGSLDSETKYQHDIPLSPMGNNQTESGKSPLSDYYRYPDATYDSYLYGWILHSTGDGEGGGGGGDSSVTSTFQSLSPEQSLKGAAAAVTLLPSAEGNDKSTSTSVVYPTTYMEAIFAREYLPSDNMGDLNADGIPDLYLLTFGFGLVDKTTGALGGDDLASLAAYNGDLDADGAEDPDALPGDATSFIGSYIVGLRESWTKKFTADLEIRGFGPALNDAPIQMGLTGVKPDIVYTDPDKDADRADGEPASTLTKVEYLAWCEYAAAAGLDPDNKESWTDASGKVRWSPERPTDPTKTDTDGDGFDDGFEYYYWYLTHVGYINSKGEHRRLTGRIYDPRNPGVGKLLTSEEIEILCDPRVKYVGADAETRDTDNDGLPDIIEYEIGTNPFDFDSDGDGLPDGWEIMFAGTDPVATQTEAGINDAMRNYDGDAMAYTSPRLERSVKPTPLKVDNLFKFALVDENGDTDGIQWYVTKTELTEEAYEATEYVNAAGEPVALRKVTVDGVDYVTEESVVTYRNAAGRCVLAKALSKAKTWTVAEVGEEETKVLVRLMPTLLPVGTVLDEEPAEETVTCSILTLKEENEYNTAWVYGQASVADGSFGNLAIGRYQTAPTTQALAALPEKDDDICYLHALVYQEFGFDPRTAWNPNTPLAKRWGGEKEENFNKTYGYAGVATRTRAYTTYDEFLVYSYFLNNGTETNYGLKLSSDKVLWLSQVWGAFTTNPQGPGEVIDTMTSASDGSVEVAYYGKNSDNGADTDLDGVPDGWELYVMAGPKVKGKYHFVGAYEDAPWSNFGPFVGKASDASTTDNAATGSGDNDNLTELQEFAGTDSCNYYSRDTHTGFDGQEYAYSTTIVRPSEHKRWINKFFPTDPWSADTDEDGIGDAQEISNWSYSGNPASFNCGNFLYGRPVDDGSTCIPGGGLNPLAMDTDGDGLPDLWEAQFAGTPASLYKGTNVQYTVGVDYDANNSENVEGNPKQGLTDGMDGTVWDAYSFPITVKQVTTADGSVSNKFQFTIYNGVAQVVNRDYDHDGLENWQEYMTGMMRCWRYDDPVSRWDAIPASLYYNAECAFEPDLEKMGLESMDEFWYKTLVDMKSEWYNPHLVTGMNPANYMTRVRKEWDRAFTEAGTYYWLPDRVGGQSIAKVWGAVTEEKAAPLAYACCSPIDSDSDQDGLDDYYELFHGLNPLLGESGKEATFGNDDGLAEKRGPCDLIYTAWMGSGSTVEAWNASGDGNWWQKNPDLKAKSRALIDGGYDFAVYPWLNGLQAADPDGDDIRNLNEGIMPKLATETWNHADPTPLWMTDSTYSNSLTRLFFRMQTRFDEIETGDSFIYEDTVYNFRDYDGFLAKGSLAAYQPDFWDLSAPGEKYNWMYSFEENEGFDTDHDGIGDYEEGQAEYRSATDMQDADSPRRRQAMYFPGKDAALQTLPEERAHHPVDDRRNAESLFLTYTVECWVMPERVTGSQTILERAIWTQYSNPGDEEFMRKNFQLAIRDGKWYTKFDPNGTVANNPVEIISTTAAEVGKWTHLAAVYDGSSLNLYVNGVKQVAKDGLSLQPECGNAVVAVRTENDFGSAIGDYWFNREYDYKAIIVGASVRGRTDKEASGAYNEKAYLALDLSRGIGWSAYKDFFKGYVDEVRIWDGARSFEDILGDYQGASRYTRETAIKNRSAYYSKWGQGYRRNVKGTSMPAELRYHWSFDSVPAAQNKEQVLKSPHGFELGYGKAYLSRPIGYTVDWWAKVVGGYGSVYAGALDWVTWIPNTVTHLPFYDYTTLDSVLWSENYCGNVAGTYSFPRTAEPVSRWTQMTYNGVNSTLAYQTTGSRHRFVNTMVAENPESTLAKQFDFASRSQVMAGADLLPLGGAFAKYVDEMWDDQGASSMWEYTGADGNNNGLPDWWEQYAKQYLPEGVSEETVIDWNTTLVYNGQEMKAGEAYQRDLARGFYLDAYQVVHPADAYTETAFKQTSAADGLIPDWWKSMTKIEGEEPLADTDNDGLNNYVEYMVSEVMPFGLSLNPRLARTNVSTLDYFRKVGKLYIGEMLTDHDQMEDHWERSLGNDAQGNPHSDPTVWDADLDRDEDGWSSFAENRYNGYMMSTLAQLSSHAVGDIQAVDSPVPTIKLSVRYNGTFASAESGEESGSDTEEGATGSSSIPTLVVRTFTDATSDAADAEYSLKPGATVSKSVYLGGWENRIVRGTLGPGNVDISTLDIMFAQVPQSDLYSWYDESGLHLARPYAEFQEALERNPNIVQNLQAFQWSSLVAPTGYDGVLADRAVTVSRDALTQTGYINVYGERVGTINLTTGEFTFDMNAMNQIRPLADDGTAYTYSTTASAAWAYKEAIFKITYNAKIPSVQSGHFDVSLATPDKGIVRGGKNTILAFYDTDGSGEYTPGEPFGVLNDVEIGWAGRSVEIELTDLSAVTPRVSLGGSGEEDGGQGDDEEGGASADASASDRGVRVGTATFTDGTYRFAAATVPATKSRVRVVRYKVDDYPVYKVGVDAGVVLDKTFDLNARSYLHEGDFLRDGKLDIDWDNLYTDVVDWQGAQMAGCDVTNVTYIIVYNWDESAYKSDTDTTTVVKASSTLVTRRFEKRRSVPTPCPERMVINRAQPTFCWKIDNEDTWASWFGSTYTAFKVIVKDASGATVYDSGVRLMPAKDSEGVYSWTAPIYVGSVTPQGKRFENLKNYTWEVAVYNAKFKTDSLVGMETRGNPFSAPLAFRMNVTTADTSSYKLKVAVSYAGPATKLTDKIRVQAFDTPDFTGDPLAEATVGTTESTVELVGLGQVNCFIRAYIDTNGNGKRDDWESWGYLCERDLANAAGIFNPVSVAAKSIVMDKDVRTVYIEDCDTDRDFFPDVWEAEQNGGEFVAYKSGKGQGPASGTAVFIGANTNLDAKLDAATSAQLAKMTAALRTAAGVALLTGVSVDEVAQTADGGYEIPAKVEEETMQIVGLTVDAAAGKVMLKIGAELSGEVDPAVAGFLPVTVQKGAPVTVNVYHTETIGGAWTLKATQTVTISEAGADMAVTFDEALPSSGFFKTEICR